jgi:hypothetical protein
LALLSGSNVFVVNAISQRVCHATPNPCRTVIRDLRARFLTGLPAADVSIRKRFSADKRHYVLHRTDASSRLKRVMNRAQMPAAKGIKVRSTDLEVMKKGIFCLMPNLSQS